MNNNVKVSNPMKVITYPDTRWSYANVWEPKSINGGTPTYSVSLIRFGNKLHFFIIIIMILSILVDTLHSYKEDSYAAIDRAA